MNQAAEFLASRLPNGLQHPGDEANGQKPFTVNLPGLMSTGLPPEMEQQFAADAGLPSTDTPKLVAEATIHTLEQAGYTVIRTSELEQLRTEAADAPDGTRIITAYCRCDHGKKNPLLSLTVGKTDDVTIYAPPLLKALKQRAANCPHEVTP